jgi:hypothetical protein
VHLDARIEGTAGYGTVNSVLLGPSADWEKAQWAWDTLPGDSVRVEILGHKASADPAMVSASAAIGQHIIAADDEKYSQYSFRGYLQNTETRIPPKFRYWKAYFGPLAETAIDISGNYLSSPGTLQQGDSIRLRISTRNIGSIAIDSLWAQAVLYNTDNIPVYSEIFMLGRHGAGQLAALNLAAPTTGLSGSYLLRIEFNPVLPGKMRAQEGHYFNNVYSKHFFIETDNAGPLLAVLFSGEHITDGQYVMSKPEIEILLYDENIFLPLADTSSLQVYLQQLPAGEIYQLYYSAPGIYGQLSYAAAASPGLPFSAKFTPHLPDGHYLLEASGTDASGNSAGSQAYRVSFRVSSAETFSRAWAAPNPFSDKVFFIFSIAGAELPDEFVIDIYSACGALAASISPPAGSPLGIGPKRKQLEWDGRAANGSLLPSGIYFYKLAARSQGRGWSEISIDYDGSSPKAYGKIIIAR